MIPEHLRPGVCARCGRDPATGYAGRWTNERGEEWYCHGDEDESPTCYEASEASTVWTIPW